jgi:hypothetical protein
MLTSGSASWSENDRHKAVLRRFFLLSTVRGFGFS